MIMRSMGPFPNWATSNARPSTESPITIRFAGPAIAGSDAVGAGGGAAVGDGVDLGGGRGVRAVRHVAWPWMSPWAARCA